MANKQKVQPVRIVDSSSAEPVRKPTLHIGSDFLSGMGNINIGGKVKILVEGKVVMMRKKDKYDKGSGNIFEVKIDSARRITKPGKVDNSKPKVGIMK